MGKKLGYLAALAALLPGIATASPPSTAVLQRAAKVEKQKNPHVGKGLDWRLLPAYSASGLVEWEVSGHPRIAGYVDLGLDLRLVSLEDFSLDFGSKFKSPIRRAPPGVVQPDQVNYEVWIRINYALKHGEISAFAFHQSKHNVDEDDFKLNKETIAYEKYGFSYGVNVDVLAGLDLSTSIGLYANKHSNRYMADISLDARLNFIELFDLVGFYTSANVRPLFTKTNPDSYQSSDCFDLTFAVETGAYLNGRVFDMDVFARMDDFHDYMGYNTGHEPVLMIGMRFGANL